MLQLTPSILRLKGLNRPDQVKSYEAAAAVVERVRTLLHDNNFPCPPNSALGSLFLKASKLRDQWASATEEPDLLTLIQADEALRVAEAVEGVISDPAAKETIRRITKSDMSLSRRQPSKGKDVLFELDLRLFLIGRGVPVRLAEPDLVVTLDGSLGDFGIACKKVYSMANVEAQLKKGCIQLRSFGGAGIVAFNLDDTTLERSILPAPTKQAASDFLHARNQQFLVENQLLFQKRVMNGECDGILVSTTAQTDLADSSPSFNRFAQMTLWTVTEARPGAHIRIDNLRRLIERPRVAIADRAA